MTNKEYLQQYYYLDKLVKAKVEEIEMLESSVIYKSPSFSNNISSGATVSADTKLCDLVSAREELEQEAIKMLEMKKTILDKINKVSSMQYRTVLTLRYINFKKFEEIAVIMGYSYRQTTRVHGLALADFENI